MNYEFVAPRQIVFGQGRLRELPSLVRRLTPRVWLLPGSRTLAQKGTLGAIVQGLTEAGLEVRQLPPIDHEPLVEDVDRYAQRLVVEGAQSEDAILAVGGGSAIDLAKAVAGLVGEALGEHCGWPPPITDFLEGVGVGRKLNHSPLPVIAVPTTAGTGAEATRNAVISSYNPPFKKSFRDYRLMPQLVLVDPLLTVDLPPAITAATGMDAITQLIESYVSKRRQPIPRALCLQGLQCAIEALPRAVQDGSDLAAREAMCHAALLSGLALANSGLGMAHGIAAALGVHCRIPHGLACAMLVSTAVRINADACPDDFAEIVNYVYRGKAPSDSREAAYFLAERLEELCQTIGIPRKLSQVGVTREQLPAIVKDSRGTSMQGNPRELSDEQLLEILEGLL